MEIWINHDDIIEEMSDLGLDTTGWEASDYSKLDKVIKQCQRDFERLTNRKYEQATITEKINGTGKEGLVLRFFPVISIASINIVDYPGYYQALTLSDFRVDYETGIVTIVSSWPILVSNFPEGQLNIEATYIYGYASGHIPEDIQDCISDMVLLEVINRTPESWEKKGLKSLRIGQYAESYGYSGETGGAYGPQRKNYLDHIAEIVRKYKRTLVV